MLPVTIGGVNYHALRTRPVGIEFVQNERNTARFSCVVSGALPSKLAEVYLFEEDETTKIFGGVLLDRQVEGIVDGEITSIVTFKCGDFLTHTDNCYLSLSYTVDVDLEDVIDAIVTGTLSDYGITYTPTVTGKSLGPFTWDSIRCSDGLRMLTERTGMLFEITPDKELLLYEAGDRSAPHTITNAQTNCEDLRWKDTGEFAATKITIVGGAGTRDVTESFTADGLTHGGTTEYVTAYPASQDYQGYWPNLITVDGSIVIAWWGPLASGQEWIWNPVTHTLEHDDSYGLTPGGTVISFSYRIQYPFRVSVTSGATPIVERVYTLVTVMTIEEATEIAQGRFDRKAQDPRELTVRSHEDGWRAGQSVSVNLTTRACVGDFFLTRVSMTRHPDANDGLWIYNFSAIEDNIYRGSNLDEWREFVGGSSNNSSLVLASATGGSTGGGSTAPQAISVFLGGMRTASLPMVTAAWTPVLNYIEYIAPSTFVAEVRATIWARSASIGVTARLRDVTASTDVESVEVTSQTPTVVTFLSDIIAGHEYRLEILSDTNGGDVYGIGSLQSLN